jgi:hypothetical protein
MPAADPTGAEPPEEPTAAHDGEVKKGESIAEAAEAEAPMVPDAPPLEGDKQLSLAGLGKVSKTPVEATISLMSAAVPIKGLIDPDKEGLLLVRYVPAGYNYRPTRDADRRVDRWKLIQQLRPVYVTTPEAEVALRPAMEEAFKVLTESGDEEARIHGALDILADALEASREMEGLLVEA